MALYDLFEHHHVCYVSVIRNILVLGTVFIRQSLRLQMSDSDVENGGFMLPN